MNVGPTYALPYPTDLDYRLQQQPGPAQNRDIVPSFEWSMPKQKLNLLKIAAIFAAKLCASPAKIMRSESLNSNLFRRLLDDRPNRPVAQLVADQLPALGERPQQAAVLNLRRYHPGVDSLLDPDRDRDSSDSAALATKIGQDPSPLAHLDSVNVHAGQLLPPQGAAQQQRQNHVVPLPFDLGAVRDR